MLWRPLVRLTRFDVSTGGSAAALINPPPAPGREGRLRGGNDGEVREVSAGVVPHPQADQALLAVVQGRRRSAGGSRRIAGEFERIESPSMLVYTWSVEPLTTWARVTVRFERRGDATEVIVFHGRDVV